MTNTKNNKQDKLILKLMANEPFTKEELNIEGDLDLDGCRKLTSLPAGLKVGGNLSLKETKNITTLPEGLKVGGDLFARYARLSVYTKKELQEMIKTGFIKGRYYRK